MYKNTYGTMYYVDDMAKSVEFFTNSLGLKPAYQSDSWTEFPIGNHKLCLHIKEKNKNYDSNGILITSHDGIKALFDQMKRDGINAFGLHEVHPEAWTFHIKDNSNNELSFFGKP